ncbi:Type III restriction enzyme, res subunit family protein [Tritrichomonas foetus]|uniref:RNA helicase n=1 Tax=Tritrichomonas foetus TaxID=1144522 RepID=A0A1J4JHR1_9EUKA|nr:Type III restriction enzyme, res subunit family protein [Tritrichomonas foetus]|eukprot:OHS97037.1 Type III restriction enzyme, res subunit family protein [Tritrichomonas foetus]
MRPWPWFGQFFYFIMSSAYVPPHLRAQQQQQQQQQNDGYQQQQNGSYQQQNNQPRQPQNAVYAPQQTNNNYNNQDRQPHFAPQAYQPPNNRRNNLNRNISRSYSVPGQLNSVADSVVEERFAQNEDTSDMSVYDGADVVVHSNQEIEPITQFPGCGIRNEILLSVANIGFKSPTSVQKYAIPYILAHHDVLVTSQTGSGKTAAYMLPVISQIINQQRTRDPMVVALVPTRELALQIQTETNKFTNGTGLKTVCVFGGAPMNDQLRQLKWSCDILIATPGRLIDIMTRGQSSLSCVQHLILDEADRMLDMGFEPQIDEVINGFDMPSPENRQTLLFSATFPIEVQNLARRFMRADVTRIEVGMQDAPSLIQQRFMYVPENSKLSALQEIIAEVEGQTLVFAERKVKVDHIEEFLYEEGCHVVAIHGDRDMQDRRAALRGFTNGLAKIMIATDVAARGIDIPSVAHVVNLDLPTDVDSYIHRIGRTGRAGKHGIATSFWNESNASFLIALISHFRQNRQPIPEGLEEFERENRKNSGGGPRGSRGGRGGRGGRGNFPRDRSYNNVSYRYY